MSSNSKIDFYADSLVVESFLSDGFVHKSAQGSFISSLIESTKNYFGQHIDPNDRTGSFLDRIAPGIISTTLRALGFGWISTLIGLSVSVFHIDIASILSKIYNQIKDVLSKGPTTSAKIDSIVKGSVDEHAPPATEEEASEAEEKMKKKSIDMRIREANLVKIALKSHQNITKEAAFYDFYSKRKSATSNVLKTVLSWFFKVALSAAGLMVAGDVINAAIGRPSALTGTIQHGKPTVPETSPFATTTTVSFPTSTQTKFPVKKTYVKENYNTGEDIWEESILANKNNIDNMVVNFAKEVYDGLDGMESIIKTTPSFQVVSNRIFNYNRNNLGDYAVIIPRLFHSKKEIVDLFIDDVAKKA